ncbi:MAG: hypothetical protein J2P15_15365 [Micromonosporaceae bacterium]|nr:hypothetical protein [Micromonosporaceae bacterium]
MGGFAVSLILDEFREIGGGIASRVARLHTMVRRMTAGPALARGGVFAAALVAQLVAWPAAVTLGRPALLLALVAIMPAFLPRGPWPSLAILTAVLGWFLATTSFQEGVTYPRLVLLAGAIYLVHSLAALAAVLPYDSLVAVEVFVRWLLRVVLILVLTAALALFVVAATGWVGSGRYLLASLLGLAVMAALAGYLASLAAKRP